MLEVRSLSKSFLNGKNKTIAINNISFTISPGEIYALIGPNGAGKTTTIKIIVGLYRCENGEVRLFGKDILQETASLRNEIGYIPDEPVFYPYLTGYEMLEFIRILYKVPSDIFRKKLKELLSFYPIGEILDNLPSSYSRGNRQKLAIISALSHNPKLLVVDEPIVGLDPISCEKTAVLFQEFVKTGGMILVSTHTLSFVEEVATRVGIIDKGKIIMEGTPKEIVRKTKARGNLTESFISIISR